MAEKVKATGCSFIVNFFWGFILFHIVTTGNVFLCFTMIQKKKNIIETLGNLRPLVQSRWPRVSMLILLIIHYSSNKWILWINTGTFVIVFKFPYMVYYGQLLNDKIKMMPHPRRRNFTHVQVSISRRIHTTGIRTPRVISLSFNRLGLDTSQLSPVYSTSSSCVHLVITW
jgi:hypothetical protein